jgi:hypothetical protein
VAVLAAGITMSVPNILRSKAILEHGRGHRVPPSSLLRYRGFDLRFEGDAVLAAVSLEDEPMGGTLPLVEACHWIDRYRTTHPQTHARRFAATVQA